MATCYLCGVESEHSYDCPKKFITPIVSIHHTIIKITESIPQEEIVTFKSTRDDRIWRIAKILKMENIPQWATHGWYCVEKYTVKELVNEWAKKTPSSWPWSLREGSLEVGKLFNGYYDYVLIVSAQVKEEK